MIRGFLPVSGCQWAEEQKGEVMTWEGDKAGSRWPVSRILFRDMVPLMTIHLDLPSPAGSCGPPETPDRSSLDAMSSVFPI